MLHQKVVVSRKPALKNHKITHHFNLSFLEYDSIEFKLSLVFANLFPIGIHVMVLNKFVSRPAKHWRNFICFAVVLKNHNLVFVKRIFFMYIYAYIMNINT